MELQKLSNLPHILWINLNKDEIRKEYMESEFKKYNLPNTRIEALEGVKYKDFCITNKVLETSEDTGTIGCFCSHIKALEHFVNNPSIGDYCLIAEDDLSFEYIPYWKKSFWEYIKEAPSNFNIIQLTVTYSYQYMIYRKFPRTHTITKQLPYMYGAGLYMVTRKGATMLLSLISKSNNIYDLRGVQNAISDCFLYEAIDDVYSIPLFTFNTQMGSNIHSDHIDRIHIPCKNVITRIWKKMNKLL